MLYLAVEVDNVNASDRQLARRYSIGNSRAEQRGDGWVVHKVEVTDTRETLDRECVGGERRENERDKRR